MKLSIMQPYFFPYIGYFSLINYVDRFVIFDSVQFIRHGWISRNRILKPVVSWQYIIVPVKKHKRDTLIKDIQISEQENWKKRILGQIEHYKKNAPYFMEVKDFLDECFSYEEKSLFRLNYHYLKKTCQFLDISCNFDIYSDMNMVIDDLNKDGKTSMKDADVMYQIINDIDNDPSFKNLIGGLGKYKKTSNHTWNIHVDTRGYIARW